MDAIDRQAAIDLIENESRKWGDEYGVSDVLCDLSDMPSVQPEPKWRPIKARPMDEKERQEWSEKLGYDIEYEEAIIYANLPDDGEEVLICYKWGNVCIDTFRQEDGCYFEDNGDMDGVIAWMPLPEPYKGEKE